MKTLIIVTTILLSSTAMGATVKQVWNLPATAMVNGVANGYVTAASDCLLDNEYLFSCTNDHEPRAVEDEEEDAAS